MEVTKIEYSRLYSLGNFEHERISVEVTLRDDETPHQAVCRAREFVKKEHEHKPIAATEIASARRIVENPDAYTGYQVKEARKIVELSQQPEEIQF